MQENIKDAFKNPSQRRCYYTGNASEKAARILGVDRWDWTPQKSVNIEPYYWNTHTMALAFGCEKMFTTEGKEWNYISEKRNFK
jgi:hypothetical protein